MNDPVNSPSHYAGSCSIECIDALEMVLGGQGLFFFCYGNAFKYIWRHKHKNNAKEDLSKAEWYYWKCKELLKFFDDSDKAYVEDQLIALFDILDTYQKEE